MKTSNGSAPPRATASPTIAHALARTTEAPRTDDLWTRFVAVVRARLSGFLVSQAAQAEVTVLDARRRVAHAEIKADAAEAELRLRQALQSASPERAAAIEERAVAAERAIYMRNEARQGRLPAPQEPAGATDRLVEP